MMQREIKNRLSPSEDIKWGQLSLSPLLCFHRELAGLIQQAGITQGPQNYTNKLLPNSYAAVLIIKLRSNQT